MTSNFLVTKIRALIHVYLRYISIVCGYKNETLTVG